MKAHAKHFLMDSLKRAACCVYAVLDNSDACTTVLRQRAIQYSAGSFSQSTNQYTVMKISCFEEMKSATKPSARLLPTRSRSSAVHSRSFTGLYGGLTALLSTAAPPPPLMAFSRVLQRAQLID